MSSTDSVLLLACRLLPIYQWRLTGWNGEQKPVSGRMRRWIELSTILRGWGRHKLEFEVRKKNVDKSPKLSVRTPERRLWKPKIGVNQKDIVESILTNTKTDLWSPIPG